MIKQAGGSFLTQNNVTYFSIPSLLVPDNEHYLADIDRAGTGYLLDFQTGCLKVIGYDFLQDKPIDGFEWII